MLECKKGAIFHITKSGLSLNNKEILCYPIVLNSCYWSKSFNTKITPFQSGVEMHFIA